MCTAWYGRYIPVHQLTDTRTACYRAVPPIAVVSTPLPPKSDRYRAVTINFDRWRPISNGISQEREKKNMEPINPSPARDFFSPHGEKEQGN
ncbi:hypothetical protein BHE74_00022551, partial [Ensete ventricosum]